ncbi:MAG: hypothetical protein R6U66_08130 [Bacteroidales bacterium]
MKKLSLAVLLLSFLMSACGGASNEADKQETKKEKKQKSPSKSTEEGMKQLLEACHIEVPAPLEFTEVSKSSSNYKISYKATEVDEATREELDSWFANQTEHLSEHGWEKRVMNENQEMMGSVINEIIFFKPQGSSIDVTYGITISSTYSSEDKTYKVHISAD